MLLIPSAKLEFFRRYSLRTSFCFLFLFPFLGNMLHVFTYFSVLF